MSGSWSCEYSLSFWGLCVREILIISQPTSTIQADQPRGLSQMFDEKFDEAYDVSVKENDLPHIKWGRIDYISVTTLTTKWVVWQ